MNWTEVSVMGAASASPMSGRGVPNLPHLWAWAVHVASAQVVFVVLFGAVALHMRILES